jgi:hypothetical protein
MQNSKTAPRKITKEVIDELIYTTDIELNSTHTKLCLPIIERIYKKMAAGLTFPGIKISGKLICDGHHRYLASLLAKVNIEKVPTLSTSATMPVQWESILFEETDWDSADKLNNLNEQDAIYNNIPIERIIELLR